MFEDRNRKIDSQTQSISRSEAMRFMLLVGLVLSAFGGTQAYADPTYELKMSSSVAGLTPLFYFDESPWVQAGDQATLTVRYQAGSTPDQMFGGGALYKNQITYFSFELARGGTTSYFGETTGNFGQISVINDATNINTGLQYDLLTFRLFDNINSYPSGTRSGTQIVPAVAPGIDTGNPAFGDLVFKNFLLHFTTTDGTAWNSLALPTTLASSQLGPQIGTGPWSGRWDLTADNGGVYQIGMSFGGGTERLGSPTDVTMAFRVLDDAGAPDVSQVPEPTSVLLGAIGLASAGVQWRKRRGLQD